MLPPPPTCTLTVYVHTQHLILSPLYLHVRTCMYCPLTSSKPFPVILNSECQSGPKAPPTPIPIPVSFPFPFPVPACLSIVYLVLLRGLTSMISLPVADAESALCWWAVSCPPARWGRKKVAAPSSKKVRVMDWSLMAHTTSQPPTSYLGTVGIVHVHVTVYTAQLNTSSSVHACLLYMAYTMEVTYTNSVAMPPFPTTTMRRESPNFFWNSCTWQ